MQEKWILHTKKADFTGIGEKLGVNPVLIRVLRNRGLTDEEDFRHFFLDTLEDMHDPWLMKDMAKAVNLILAAIAGGTKIRVISDYDIDGVCSGTILVKGLRSMGAEVSLAIPDRITDGYGINERLVREAAGEGAGMILTCDNGIAAFQPVELAKSLGMTVIITDHHEIPFEMTEQGRRELIPPADAVLNPKQMDCHYPFKELCGGGVAYKLMDALYRQTGRGENAVRVFLEPAAIATIGDIVELQGENRIIARHGLRDIRRSAWPGIRKLAAVNGIPLENVGEYHIGFIMGPCLNAGGRLDSAKMAAELLMCENGEEAKAEQLALRLKELNDARKQMTQEGVEQAKRQLPLWEDQPVQVLYLPDCHESLAGIIAGRIREFCYKPTIILTDGEDGVKGSGRSIESYSMFEKLSECRELFTRFGGHPMAAGLSMEKDKIELLRQKLNERAGLSRDDLTPKKYIDMRLPLSGISFSLVEELQKLRPWGKGNERPVFAEKGLKVDKLRVFGKNRNVIRIWFSDEAGYRMEGIMFGDGDEFLSQMRTSCGETETEAALMGRENHIRADILFEPEKNEYMQHHELQMKLHGIKFQTGKNRTGG